LWYSSQLTCLGETGRSIIAIKSCGKLKHRAINDAANSHLDWLVLAAADPDIDRIGTICQDGT
jgi:hypothetical protein